MNGEERWTPRRGRLEGTRVAIFALVPQQEAGDNPDVYRSSPIVEAEEAVISFLRAVLAEGGDVTLIADEPLALLGAMVAGEYVEPFLDEQRERPPARLTIFTEPRHDENDPFTHLERLGQARVSGSRTFDGAIDAIDFDTRAVVLIGRADSRAIRLLGERAPKALFFAIDASGTRVPGDLRQQFGIRIIDEEAREQNPLFSSEERRFEDERHDQEPRYEFEFPPIALAAQLIVQRLVGESENEPPPRLAML